MAYFEKQGTFSLLCGMHSVNNLLGKPSYDKEDMDLICDFLDPLSLINPHKHFLGGEYDVNVLAQALCSQGMEMKWHNKSKVFNLKEYCQQYQDKLVGFLINVSFEKKIIHWILSIEPKHWICLKNDEKEGWVLMDSKQQRYKAWKTVEQAQKELNQSSIMTNPNTIIITVYKK